MNAISPESDAPDWDITNEFVECVCDKSRQTKTKPIDVLA